MARKGITLTEWKNAWRYRWEKLFNDMFKTTFDFSDSNTLSVQVPNDLHSIIDSKHQAINKRFKKTYYKNGEKVDTGYLSKKEFINLLFMQALNVEQADGKFREGTGSIERYFSENENELINKMLERSEEKRLTKNAKMQKYRSSKREEFDNLKKQNRELQERLNRALNMNADD